MATAIAALTSAIAGLFGLVKLAKENWRDTAIVVILLCAIGGFANSAFNKSANVANAHPSPEQKHQMLLRSYDLDAIIYRELDLVLEETGAARVLVRMLSNGDMNLANNPLGNIQTTHPVVREGVSSPDMAKYPASTLNGTLRKMMVNGPRCIRQTVDDMRYDAGYVSYLQEHQVVEAYTCPLVNKDGVHYGVIGFGYIEGDEIPRDRAALMQRLRDAKLTVERQMEQRRYEKPDTKPWWQLW